MLVTVLVLAVVAGAPVPQKQVTTAEKQAFLRLLERLPTHGEFFTDEAVQKAVPYTRVLLSLTEKDIQEYDLYSFLALSRGLVDRKSQREYGVKHFGEIAHPRIKLARGVMLFTENAASPEVVKFLRAAMERKDDAEWDSRVLGPDSKSFEKRLKEYPLEDK